MMPSPVVPLQPGVVHEPAQRDAYRVEAELRGGVVEAAERL